ncbi:MAG: hypothetical protein A3F74_24965 [Betaproteobacteria bacterium RIFCSPLOWO2_12_FULL_62_58]|nr:MAG: hypothetical protein A3F74_24965 [Betaproteobacteria bacterium RIFCSPLOWO2_12_FULL_62_58]
MATLNRPITTGDRLWADNGGRAEMHVGSTAIRLSEQTSVDVLNIDDRNVQLRLAQGSVNARLRNLPGGNMFEVDTPHGAVILNQPGSYRISVDPSGTETTVGVRSGQADVLTAASRFTVRANQQARVTDANAPSYDIAAAPPMDEFDRWAVARDHKEDRIASTRHVPPEMTGYEDLDDHGSWRVVPDYGAVWVPAGVAVGWAPYRYGRWVWISPWGWTWVDSAPWGFAPFHYGRWIWLGGRWAWAPGPVAVRPVYAPALVAFVGGSNWSVSVGIGAAPVVGWVPLGWREPYIPWYRVSPTYVRNVNVAHVTNINVTNIFNNTTVTNIRYANRGVPSGVTVVRREHFVSAKPVEPVKVSSQALAAAPVTSAAPVRTPESASFAASRPGPKPPAAATAREVVTAGAPPEVSKPPTIDRETRATPPPAPPAASAPRPQQPAERESARDRSREDTPPRAQPRPQQERRVQAPPPAAAERPIPPAPPPQARDRGGNGNNARIERQERRPAPKAEPRRDKARERPAADKKPERD